MATAYRAVDSRAMPVMSQDEIRGFLEGRSAAAAELILALRSMVLAEAPGVDEAVRFGALAYFWGRAAFGSIGGNVCMIEPPRPNAEAARLSFLHGADLDDPAGMLRGTGKAKRYVAVASAREARGSELRALVRAAARLTRPG